MKIFGQALLVAALSATAQAKKVYEMNAMVTPKRDSPNTVDPYLKENFLALRQQESNEATQEENGVVGRIITDVASMVATVGGDANKIVSTSDIDNYFNLQITTKLYFGSQMDPHDLILDTGSMVSATLHRSLDTSNAVIECANNFALYSSYSGRGCRRRTAGAAVLITTSTPKRAPPGRTYQSRMAA